MQLRLPRLAVAVVTVVGFLTLAPRASAEFLTLQFTGYEGGSVNVKLDNVSYQAYPAGPFNWKNTTDGALPPTLKTFCIELDQGLPELTPPTATFRVTSVPNATDTNITDPNQVKAIQALYGNNYDATTGGALGGQNLAFQLALWELVYDFGNVNLGTGRFVSEASAGTNGIAAGMLAGVTGGGLTTGLNSFNAGGYELVALVAPAGPGAKTQDEVQDQLYIRPKGVPAPPAVLLAGVGVLALIGRARLARRARTA